MIQSAMDSVTPARHYGDFGRNCPPISAVFGRNLGRNTQAWYPILAFPPISAILVRNWAEKPMVHAWYSILHCTSPFRCFSDQIITHSTYLISAHFALVLSCRDTSFIEICLNVESLCVFSMYYIYDHLINNVSMLHVPNLLCIDFLYT